MGLFLRLEEFIKIDVQLREHAFIGSRAVFIHCIVGGLFGGDMLIFLLQCGLGGVGRVARGREVIPLEGFFLVGILNDTIQTHWDLVVSVIRTSGFDH